MTKNNSSSQASYWGTALLNSGVSQSVVTSVQNDMATGNISAANSAISILTPAQLSSVEYNSSNYFYQDIAIPAVTSSLASSSIPFSSLPVGVQAALTDLYYNAGTGYIGPHLTAALAGGLSTGDYSAVAYELAFDTGKAGATTAYAYRATADALTALGITYTINGTQNVTAVSGTASPSQIIEFLARLIHADDGRWLIAAA